MKYCTNCIIPSTRPNISFDSRGICNACSAHNSRQDIDWSAREQSFELVVENAKSNSRGYDCVIPVSGGKDSTWQVVKCLEYGLNPLAVTWKTPVRTKIGSKNLDNLVNLGVDHIDYQVNPLVERKFLYEGLVKYGSPAIPMHMGIFNIPLNVAVKFDIPLVVWGENSAFEYGGEHEESLGFRLDHSWIRKYGVTHGTTAEDWVSLDLTRKQLTPYFGPSSIEIERHGLLAVFLGYYFPWDPETSLSVASKNGFLSQIGKPRTGYYDYADRDDEFISVHHYLKWYKFGFTRSFDNLSLEIRNGRISRVDAIQILSDRGDDTPHEDIMSLCEYLEIDVSEFFGIIEKFRNTDVWIRRSGGWKIDGFLIDDWDWE